MTDCRMVCVGSDDREQRELKKEFKPEFSITNRITAGLTRIERARGFLEAAALSEARVREMGRRALILEMTSHRLLIGAGDDGIVPFAYTESLGKSLDAKIVKATKGGHFLASDGYTEFPLLLDELLKITVQKPNQSIELTPTAVTQAAAPSARQP